MIGSATPANLALESGKTCDYGVWNPVKSSHPIVPQAEPRFKPLADWLLSVLLLTRGKRGTIRGPPDDAVVAVTCEPRTTMETGNSLVVEPRREAYKT